jgi:hypothetical protein
MNMFAAMEATVMPDNSTKTMAQGGVKVAF